jgi:hypothetical protein
MQLLILLCFRCTPIECDIIKRSHYLYLIFKYITMTLNFPVRVPYGYTVVPVVRYSQRYEYGYERKFFFQKKYCCGERKTKIDTTPSIKNKLNYLISIVLFCIYILQKDDRRITCSISFSK